MKFRACQPGDVDAVVPLIYSAGPDAFRYVFSVDKELQALEFLRYAFLKGGGEFGFKDHEVALDDGHIVAVVGCWQSRDNLSYILSATRQIFGFYGWRRGLGVVVRGLRFESIVSPPKANRLCLHNLGVRQDQRGKGIGERTGHSAQIGNSKFAPVAADALQAHAVRGRAASSIKPVRQRREARPRLPQFDLALANFGSRNRNRDGPCLPRDPFSRLGTRYCAATRQGQKEKG